MPRSFSCPVCGEDVPAGARACPECGACDKSGWSGEAHADGLDLPDEEFDYSRFVAEEFGDGAPQPQRQKVWALVALVVLIAFAASIFGGCWAR